MKMIDGREIGTNVGERIACGQAKPLATHAHEYRWLKNTRPPKDWTCEWCEKTAESLSCEQYALAVLKSFKSSKRRIRNNADAVGSFPFHRPSPGRL